MSFPLTAEQHIKRWNNNFPTRFKEAQGYSWTLYIVWRNQLTPSNVRYLNSLGFDALHFNPLMPFNQELFADVYKKGFFQDGYVLKLWRDGVDFYVIYQSLHMMTRAVVAATKIQRFFRNWKDVVSLEAVSNDMKLEDFVDEVIELDVDETFDEMKDLNTHILGDGGAGRGDEAFDKWSGFGSTTHKEVMDMLNRKVKEEEEVETEVEEEVEEEEAEVEEVETEEEEEEAVLLAEEEEAAAAEASSSEDYSDDSGWGEKDQAPLVKSLRKSKSEDNIASSNSWWKWE